MPMLPFRAWRGLITAGFALAAVLAAGCAHKPVAGEDAARWSDARQLVLVILPDWDSTQGTLRRYQRTTGGDWRAEDEAQPVVVGRAGAAWGLGLHDIPPGNDGPVKREGDGRSPAGVFAIGEAFGYADRADTRLRYSAMDAGDWCIDVPASPLYNRIVDSAEVGADAVAGSSEPMRRDLHAGGDQRYRLGFVVEHNAQARAQAGSCIFAHLWKSPDSTTAGCTAMAPPTMEALLHWLDADRRPVFVLLPQAEYRRLWQAWRLPAPEQSR
jgi:L,D-peptidoglycan transpeptidase YkuD (ErfK/YbiS/YcfS/YnhG family)